jgi:DNA-binding NtrC family response regulator
LEKQRNWRKVDKRVLFIDDEFGLWEKALREELANYGFELRCEGDPSRALKQIESFKPDIVLLDILFGDQLLGKLTLEKIKKKYPDLPVMMITGTMEKSEYRPEDYVLADYRYAKAALTGGDFSDLAAQLDRLIEKARSKREGKEDDTGLDRFGFIVGKTKAMREMAEMVQKVANQEHTVLIRGESGTGKELMAKAIHCASPRSGKPMVKVSCAAIPETLLESELFGHEKGAFTGATQRRIGRFEEAGGGSIFLDEIGDLSPGTQVKLLRILQDKEFQRLGSNLSLKTDVRVITATHRNLEEAMKKGLFREDLYYRLNVITIYMPPLRERKEDIPLFFEHFVRRANELSQKKVLPILRDDVKDLLTGYPWPGNIREMQNAINRAVSLADENILQVSNFGEMTKETNEEYKLTSDVSEIVDRIYKGELAWSDICKEFGAKGVIRKEVLLKIIDRWMKENQRRPSSEELADLLFVSPGNMRRVLSEWSIKLTEMSK